jgi:glycosyltransferase involved in cell wall biosynthesis
VQPLVSIVVPTFNRCSSLCTLLNALAVQNAPPTSFEVIVVDDGSTDGTVEHVRSLAMPYALRVVQQAHDGPARARNLGVEQARGEVILFLDDDVVPAADLVATHVAAQTGHDDLVVIGPMLPPRDWPRPAWIRWEEDKLVAQYEAMRAGKYACTPRQFFTANVSLPRACFLAAGGFDPTFKRAEDVELGYRLRDQGARFAFHGEAQVVHYPTRTFEGWCRTPYQYGRYDVEMARKGHEALHAACREFHVRHWLNRWLTRLCVGRQRLVRAAVFALGRGARVADELGAQRPAALAMSGIFSVLYWQGVADELGSARRVWRSIAEGARR